jgi:hypothetical protein
MNDTTPALLEKFKLVFDVLNFSEDKKEKLFAELLDGIFALAMTKIIQKNPDLGEKLKSVNMQNLTSDRLDSLNTTWDPSTEALFAEELHKILSEYIVEVTATVDDSKKQRIQEIWA